MKLEKPHNDVLPIIEQTLGQKVESIEPICLCDGFRGGIKDTQIMRIKCGCDKCKNAGLPILQSQEIIDHKYEILASYDTTTKAGICSKCFEVSVTMLGGICNTCLSQEDDQDEINWPKHYNTCKIQPIDVIEDWGLDFRLANAVKYIQRHEHKGNAKKDLEKAIWYIQRYIDKELTKEGK